MKKNFFAVVACACAMFFASCGNKITTEHFLTPNDSITYGDTEKLDSLSYIMGLQVGFTIDAQIVPMYKIDYNTFYTTFKQALTTDEPIIAGKTTITKDSIEAIGNRIFSMDFRQRMNAAMMDTTGTAEIFANAEEKELVTKFIATDLAYNVKSSGMPLQAHWILKAASDVHNETRIINDEQAEAFVMNYYTVTMPMQAKAESEQWLADIATVSGVNKTESGILYMIVEAGDQNIKPTADTDTVKVIYTGKDKYGNVFDSNRWADMPEQRQQMMQLYYPEQAGQDSPIEFPLNGVIKGWTEGMKLIGKGGKITLWIPAELAYGETGSGRAIGPNEALRFDVELLEVNGK